MLLSATAKNVADTTRSGEVDDARRASSGSDGSLVAASDASADPGVYVDVETPADNSEGLLAEKGYTP